MILEDIDLKILPSNTYKVINILLEKEDLLSRFVLVGETALSLYLRHRKSEDLDFFPFKKDSFDKKEIIEKILMIPESKIINESDDQIDININNVKITFYDSQLEFLKPDKIENLNIASIESLIALKVQVLFLRAKFRDYYDLYFIIKKFGIEKVYNVANKYFPLSQKQFHSALLYTEDIEEDSIAYLEPVENLSKKDIQKFFEKEIKTSIKSSFKI